MPLDVFIDILSIRSIPIIIKNTDTGYNAKPKVPRSEIVNILKKLNSKKIRRIEKNVVKTTPHLNLLFFAFFLLDLVG